MARGVSRGEIWLYAFKRANKRCPVVVLTRPEVIGFLNTVMVAPITSTIRGAPSEVAVGVDEGLKRESAVNLDHVQTVDKQRLQRYVGSFAGAGNAKTPDAERIRQRIEERIDAVKPYVEAYTGTDKAELTTLFEVVRAEGCPSA